MRTSRSSRALLAAFAALGGFLSFANAQSVATTPVGAVSVSINPNADQRFGVTLQRPSTYAGVVSTVSGSVINVSGSAAAVTATSYAKFLSGAAVGQWAQISSVGASSYTLSESAVALGVVAGDKFEVRPFWTLATLFPDGQGFPASNDPEQPAARLYLYSASTLGVNLSAASNYLFVKNVDGVPNGWYNGDFESADNVIVNPETFLVIRNVSAAIAKIVTIGDVPAVVQANTVVARVAGAQDNLVYNPYPAASTLGSLGLITSGAVRPWNLNESTPRDVVFLYSASSTSANPSSAASFYYLQGVDGIPDGWYNDDAESGDNYSVPAGGAFVVRKFGGASVVSEWKPALPYTL